MDNTKYNPINCHELFAQFNNKREAMILVYLLVEADDKGRVNHSIYALAQELNMHRQTLTRTINNLCEKGYASWEKTAAPRRQLQLCMTYCLTKNVTENVTENVTKDVTENVTSSLETKNNTTQSESSRYGDMGNHLVTSSVTLGVTRDVTNKEETKEKKEENSPAPHKEEKKQKKEENNPSPVRAREKMPEMKMAGKKKIAPTATTIELRRQKFIDSLMAYSCRYGEEMIRHFVEYWTETNRSNTRMRFEMQTTWNTHLRLARWARNEQTFNHHNNNYHDTKHTITSAECIRQAQSTAINATEEFIRQAEIRRGGVPPHLPF